MQFIMAWALFKQDELIFIFHDNLCSLKICVSRNETSESEIMQLLDEAC